MPNTPDKTAGSTSASQHPANDPVGHFSGLARGFITESQPDGADIPSADAIGDAVHATHEILSVANDLDAKLKKLDEDRPLMTAEAYRKYTADAKEAAKSQVEDAKRRAFKAADAAERNLVSSAMPQVATNREHLARQEFDMTLGDARGADAASRVHGLAKAGSPEAQAVIGTSYGRQAIISRGVRDVEATLAQARDTVARSGSTPESQKAMANLERLKGMGNATGTALLAFRHAMER